MVYKNDIARRKRPGYAAGVRDYRGPPAGHGFQARARPRVGNRGTHESRRLPVIGHRIARPAHPLRIPDFAFCQQTPHIAISRPNDQQASFDLIRQTLQRIEQVLNTFYNADRRYMQHRKCGVLPGGIGAEPDGVDARRGKLPPSEKLVLRNAVFYIAVTHKGVPGENPVAFLERRLDVPHPLFIRIPGGAAYPKAIPLRIDDIEIETRSEEHTS